jgi:hypothetical protein
MTPGRWPNPHTFARPFVGRPSAAGASRVVKSPPCEEPRRARRGYEGRGWAEIRRALMTRRIQKRPDMTSTIAMIPTSGSGTGVN